MGRQDITFDPKAFERTALLFESKRKRFQPDAVEVLATDIVRRLATSGGRQRDFDVHDISEESIDAFCEALIQPGPEAALEFISARRAEGVTRLNVYLQYVCGAAKRLGEGWDEDRLSFVEVTYGTGHLYALMRSLRAERPSGPVSLDARKFALFATVPGEDHGIGVTMAADLFRDEGWEIDLQTDTDHDALMEHVESIRPDIIGLSLSSARRLDALVRLVVAMRLVVPHAIIGVAPGPDVEADRILGLVDVDLVFDDARSACADLLRLVELRG